MSADDVRDALRPLRLQWLELLSVSSVGESPLWRALFSPFATAPATKAARASSSVSSLVATRTPAPAPAPAPAPLPLIAQWSATLVHFAFG